MIRARLARDLAAARPVHDRTAAVQFRTSIGACFDIAARISVHNTGAMDNAHRSARKASARV